MKRFLISYLGSVEIEAETESEALEIAEKYKNSLEFEAKADEIRD